MSHDVATPGSSRLLLAAIGLLLAAYVAALALGWPQKATELANEVHEEAPAAAVGPEAPGEKPGGAAPDAAEVMRHPPYWMVLPFALLLLAIALLPLIPHSMHWWDSNLHKFYVAAGLGLLSIAYYLALHEIAVELHWPGHAVVEASPGPNLASTGAVLVNAMLGEYLPFIILLFTLYTVSGGIRIEGDLPAHPATNAAFLAAGAVLASFIGTTGAAMLLIRPVLETNKERKHVVHTVVIFIFIVCNCGGCLLPLGDPPLFLGYLKGVPFLWTASLWPAWLFVNGALVAIYYLWDRFWFYPREEVRDIARDETEIRGLKFSGLWPNVLLLAGVVFSVGLLDPSKPFPGTDWHPWMYLREVVQLGLVALSLLGTGQSIRAANNFNYAAIIEVAALFFGIFICMQAPLQILHVEGPNLGLSQPHHFFWATGSLSSVLDNAPTYVVYFETAKTIAVEGTKVAGVGEMLLAGVSLGAVFMGSMTYIGNGPNFMVKAIAEKSGVKMPSFFGYVVYSCVILLPLFYLVTRFFL